MRGRARGPRVEDQLPSSSSSEFVLFFLSFIFSQFLPPCVVEVADRSNRSPSSPSPSRLRVIFVVALLVRVPRVPPPVLVLGGHHACPPGDVPFLLPP